ncbi:hypothetical protein M2X97_23555 [Klebsiella pneumoniae]|nr:hypothetical protein [Klebsiella pneumoniae]
MKAFADVVVGDKIQYGASDLFRTVTDIEKGRGVNGFTVFSGARRRCTLCG